MPKISKGKNNESYTMTNNFTIPDNLFDRDLLCFLNPNRFNDIISKEKVKLLHKICFCKICDFGTQMHIRDMNLTEKEYNTIIDNDWQNSTNIEIKARCCDILKNKEKDKRGIIIKASDAYIEVFHLTESMDYLERAVSIRNFKQVNNDDFLNLILKEISAKALEYPFWLSNITKALLDSYSIEKLSSLTLAVEKCVQEMKLSKNHHKERKYIDTLYLLSSITKEEQHRLKALSFESEGDYIWNKQEENTFYPNLPDLYHSAYHEINEIKLIEPDIHERIKVKLIEANKYFIEILSKAGISYKMPFPEEEKEKIEKWIANEKWESFLDFIIILFNIPFASKDNIERYIDVSSKGSVISSMLGSNQLNDKGNTIGLDNPENSIRTEAHIYYRQKILYALWIALDKAKDMKLVMEEDILFFIMKNRKPYFLHDDDRLIFWVKGFMSGFNRDFINASHILIPQIEHALRNIAETYHGSLVKLEEERQDEATLGAIFKRLENVIQEEIRFEIESFLQSGIDVNFRNKLSHGLLSSFEVMQYGIYLWWLSIKLFFNIEKIMLPKKKLILL